jgi:WD40 repeat protein/tRNA A-37 threonylcarbamoyl transferase component Bud32
MPVSCQRCRHVVDTAIHLLPDENHCPICGAAYDVTVATMSLEGSRPLLARLGKFELLEEVGAGSYGTVYKARDPELDRIVAIKVPRATSLTRPANLDRFLREARSVAQLRHPRIVPIFEAGEFGGVPYIVSEFVEGVTLADMLTARPISPGEAARLVAELAEALHYAHVHGVIHRDVKPTNILLGHDLAPHLMDFGLAKREGAIDNTVTLEGQVLGTPAYMSPEQARGDSARVDGRTDVYSLGVVLYQMLAGELPFRGNLRMLLHQVQHTEPRGPRSLNDRVPADLETICLKCLQKEPSQRFATAAALEADLRRHLRGETIQARPVSGSRRIWNWARRRPALSASLAALFITTVVGFFLVSGYAWQADVARQAEATQRLLAERALGEADRHLYFHRAALAYRELLANNPDRAEELLDECPEHLRDWEWYFVKRCCNLELDLFYGHALPISSVAYSPDGKWIASSSASPSQFNRDGDIKVWQRESKHELVPLLGHRGGVYCVAFSLDSQRLASAGEDGTVRIWELKSSKEVLRLTGHSGAVSAVAFSPDGRWLASVGSNPRDLKAVGEAILWDAATGKVVRRLGGHTAPVRCLAFSRDGQKLATGGGEFVQAGEIRVYDVATGEAVSTMHLPSGGINDVAFSADGRTVASANADMTVRIWDVTKGEVTLTMSGHSAPVAGVQFSPDGRRLASASGTFNRGEAKLWNVDTGKELQTLRGASTCVAFSPKGGELATASPIRAVKVWDALSDRESVVFRGQAGPVLNIALSNDGRYLAAASYQASVRVWDSFTQSEVLHVTGLPGVARRAAFSTDGKRLVTVSGNFGQAGDIHVWDIATGKQLLSIHGEGDPIRSVVFSPDGTRLLGAIGMLVEPGKPGLVKVWDARDGRELLVLDGQQGAVSHAIFSPDGTTIASCGEDRRVRLWDARTGAQRAVLHGHQSVVQNLVFSNDGQQLATVGWDGMVRIWRTSTGGLLQTLRGGVSSPTFNATGTRLAAIGADQTIRVWDLASGQETLTLRAHTEPARAVLFSPDGERLVTAAGDEIKVWDGSPSARELQRTRPLRFGTRPRAMAPPRARDPWPPAGG